MSPATKTRKQQVTSAADNVATADGQASPVAGAAVAPGLPPASTEAKRLAAAILEVLAGARGPSEAAQVLGISQCRYYQLETRALNGLLAACESRRHRKGRGPINELAALRQECERLRRECGRQQALVRAAQRTVGLTTPPPPAATPTEGKKKRRKRRPTARALKVAALLQADVQPAATAEDHPSAGVETVSAPNLGG